MDNKEVGYHSMSSEGKDCPVCHKVYAKSYVNDYKDRVEYRHRPKGPYLPSTYCYVDRKRAAA